LSQEDVKKPELFSELRSIDFLIKGEFPGWKFAMTVKGIMSMVPTRSKEGDVVAIVFGADVPLVLRPVPEKDGQFMQIGTAYVHVIMNGEVMRLEGMHKSRSRH
jgi:hypothetical protein